MFGLPPGIGASRRSETTSDWMPLRFATENPVILKRCGLTGTENLDFSMHEKN